MQQWAQSGRLLLNKMIKSYDPMSGDFTLLAREEKGKKEGKKERKERKKKVCSVRYIDYNNLNNESLYCGILNLQMDTWLNFKILVVTAKTNFFYV